jgi:4-amino-4-deoxy-L-arabinose transferase-like glycosyltransferase
MFAALPRAAWIVLIALFAAAWFVNLDERKLQHPDEGRYAEIAREMTVTRDWLTPRLNGLKYFEKPALQYWLTAASIDAFGVREGAVRLVPALAGFLAVLAIGYAGWRLAGPEVGAYSALALVGSVWWFGNSHFVTLDALLSSLLAIALAAFLIAQRAAARARERFAWMMAAWAAIAAATLTKGLVALVIPCGALFFYTLATRDFALWKRLHVAAGLTLAVAIAAPWFVAVSRANPEFARFFFVHEHFERFLTTEHQRTGAWWYFVPLLLLGMLPWLGVWVWTLSSSWRDAVRESNGFSWPRFCLVWAAFVLVFFSASGSKLPSYILPMFPALALPLGVQLARVALATLYRSTLVAAIAVALLLVAALFGYDRLAARLADAHTPLVVYNEARPWFLATLTIWLAGTVFWLALCRRPTPAARTMGIVAMALASIVALQFGFAGNDAFRMTRSAAGLAAALTAESSPGYDAGAPIFQVHMYDQTLPFYLRRPTTVVAFRDELALGLDAEPARGIATIAEWEERWRTLPQAYAVMAPDTLDELAADGVPYRVVAREPRRMLIARR